MPPERLPGRRPVRMRRTGEARRAALREVHFTGPLVAPQGAPRVHRRLAGKGSPRCR
jgi:hypothetical protein